MINERENRVPSQIVRYASMQVGILGVLSSLYKLLMGKDAHDIQNWILTDVSEIRGTLSLSYNLRLLLVDGLREGATEPQAGY